MFFCHSKATTEPSPVDSSLLAWGKDEGARVLARDQSDQDSALPLGPLRSAGEEI